MKIILSGAGRLGPDGRLLVEKAVLTALGAKKKKTGELCVIFVDNKKIRVLNKQFLGRNRTTDVIAFGYEESPFPSPRPSPKGREREINDSPFGDIYICWDAARNQARRMKHSLLREAVTLSVHGALHLVGFDDGKVEDQRRMFLRQDFIVGKLLGTR